MGEGLKEEKNGRRASGDNRLPIVWHGDYSKWYCIAYLKVAGRVDVKSSHHKKNKLFVIFMMMGGDHFSIYVCHIITLYS